jgi:hypothetical protein
MAAARAMQRKPTTEENAMALPRRRFLQRAASGAALPAVGPIAGVQVYPTQPVRLLAGL